MGSDNIDDIARLVADFVRERGWERFHNPKDLAISISVEAGELLELFQWSGTEEEITDKTKKARIAEEVADVIIYCVSMANALDIDLAETIRAKLDNNKRKYPIEKWRNLKEWKK